MQLFIKYSFDSDCVHIYVSNFNLTSQTAVGGYIYPFKLIYIHTWGY
jgi:hypothetical protein